jgi:hypothetical protein
MGPDAAFQPPRQVRTPAGVHSGAGLVFAAKQIDLISAWMLTVLGQCIEAKDATID